MAKGQKRTNREARKPKRLQAKPAPPERSPIGAALRTPFGSALRSAPNGGAARKG